ARISSASWEIAWCCCMQSSGSRSARQRWTWRRRGKAKQTWKQGWLTCIVTCREATPEGPSSAPSCWFQLRQFPGRRGAAGQRRWNCEQGSDRVAGRRCHASTRPRQDSDGAGDADQSSPTRPSARPDEYGVSLHTLYRAAAVLAERLKVELTN